MAADTPAELCADFQVHTVLVAVLRSAAPEEGCALLIGSRCGPAWQLRWVWPCCNVWPELEQRLCRFAIDPREQLLAQKWARQRGLEVLGAAHSHPTSAPVPSDTDLELTVAPALVVIQGPAGELRAWWLGDGVDKPVQELPFRRSDR